MSYPVLYQFRRIVVSVIDSVNRVLSPVFWLGQDQVLLV
jgi:hypothetical protein